MSARAVADADGIAEDMQTLDLTAEDGGEPVTLDLTGEAEAGASSEAATPAEVSARLKDEGNDFFRAQRYEEAMGRYSEGIEVLEGMEIGEGEELPRRQLAVLYSNRAACHGHLGSHDEATNDATKAIDLDPDYLKALLRRAAAHEVMDRPEDALGDYKAVLEKDPGNAKARKKVAELQPIVDEKMEKLKEETLGKLKDLGNAFLGNFGLSLDNFAMNQTENGQYNISFNQGGGAASNS